MNKQKGRKIPVNVVSRDNKGASLLDNHIAEVSQGATLQHDNPESDLVLNDRRNVEHNSQNVAEVAAPEELEDSDKDIIDWRERAKRLQAEMENYRKRQNRLAEERIAQEKEWLLRKFLGIVDNLEQALAHARDSEAQGFKVVYAAMLALLRSEGVEPITALGKPFDPDWHEAVAMVPAVPKQQQDMVVVDEELKGYRIGERLLRPARVIVAKK